VRMRRLVRTLLAIAVVPVLGSCVVASDPDFQGQDQCVPFFLEHEADPSTSVFSRLTETTAGSDVFRATVPMRSCALTKEYELHVFVDNNPRALTKIFPTERELRDVSIVVDITPERDNPGCHRVEALVSTNFQNFRDPVRSGDLAKIVWWFSNNPDASLAGCEAL